MQAAIAACNMSFSPNTKDGEICPAWPLTIKEALTDEIKAPNNTKVYKIVSGYAIKISNIDVNPENNIARISSNDGYYFTVNDSASNFKITVSAFVLDERYGVIEKSSKYAYKNGEFNPIE